MKTTLFLPVRNEIDGVRAIVPRIDPKWIDETIVVDGGSTDGTREFLAEKGFKVIDQKSKTIGGAYWECVEAAAGDVIIAFSPDGNSLPEMIPVLRDGMADGYDMIIASRYTGGAKSYDDDRVTSFGNWMFTKMVNTLFGGSYTDSLVMLRAFRRDLPERLGMRFWDLPVFELQLCMRCARKGLRVRDMPADEPLRIGGKREMSPLYNGSTLLWAIAKELAARG